MKKTGLIFLIMLLVFSFTACGGKEQPAPAPEDTQKSSATTNDSDKKKPNAQKDSKDTKESSFDERILVENDQCLIALTGIDPDNFWGYTLNTRFENKSADTTYLFSVTSAAVNGLQTDPFFATEVAPGKKTNDEINFTSDLTDYGITDYTDIELSFIVYDADNYMADAVYEGTVHIFPNGEENSTKFTREILDSDIILYDSEYISVFLTGYEWDDIWGFSANLYIVNSSDKEIMLSVDDASINGYMIDPFWATSVLPGRVAVSAITWSNEDLESNGISYIEEIEMQMSIFDANDWFADDIFNDIVLLYPGM